MAVKLIKEDEGKKYLSQREDEAWKFYNEIRFNELFDKIREIVKLPGLKFSKPDFKGFNYDRYDVDFKSDNIVNECGAIAPAFTEVYIDNFGGGISADRDNNGELFYWVSVHYSYRHTEGGTNGCKLLSATFRDGKWKFDR